MAAPSARNERRAQLRAIVRYLRAVREVVKRGAREHGRWVLFIAQAASLLRSPGYGKPDRNRAHQYAVLFHQYGRFLAGVKPPRYCVPLHETVAAWLETLEVLSFTVVQAIQADDAGHLERVVRGAAEAQIKLNTVQRVHAQTMAGLRKLYAQRPRPAVTKIPKHITWIR